jgi:hypothetical protein
MSQRAYNILLLAPVTTDAGITYPENVCAVGTETETGWILTFHCGAVVEVPDANCRVVGRAYRF